jgi:hypothetical protein
MYLPDPRDLSLTHVELVNTLRGFRAVVDGTIRGDLLTGVGLSLFHHAPTKSHWIGKHDPRVSDHDRWYFVCRPNRTHPDKVIWWQIFPERQYTPGSNGQAPARKTPRTALLTRDLKRELQKLDTEVQSVNTVRSLTHLQGLAGPEVLTQLRLFGPTHPGLVHPIYFNKPVEKPGELHDMIYHYPAWAAANGAVDMPQDLSLRMYGYGDLLPHLPRFLSRP